MGGQPPVIIDFKIAAPNVNAMSILLNPVKLARFTPYNESMYDKLSDFMRCAGENNMDNFCRMLIMEHIKRTGSIGIIFTHDKKKIVKVAWECNLCGYTRYISNSDLHDSVRIITTHLGMKKPTGGVARYRMMSGLSKLVSWKYENFTLNYSGNKDIINPYKRIQNTDDPLRIMRCCNICESYALYDMYVCLIHMVDHILDKTGNKCGGVWK